MGDVDTKLVQAARRGDADAWDSLFRTHQLPLYVFVIKMVRNETIALDLVQETLIAATRYLASLKKDERFMSWLFSIARQKCVSDWRRSKNEAEPLADHEDLDAIDESQPDDWIVAAEKRDLLLHSVDQLPAPQREVIVLFFLEEFSLESIAEITRSRVGTVKSRLHYAKKSLRKLLEKQDEIAQRTPIRTAR